MPASPDVLSKDVPFGDVILETCFQKHPAGHPRRAPRCMRSFTPRGRPWEEPHGVADEPMSALAMKHPSRRRVSSRPALLARGTVGRPRFPLTVAVDLHPLVRGPAPDAARDDAAREPRPPRPALVGGEDRWRCRLAVQAGVRRPRLGRLNRDRSAYASARLAVTPPIARGVARRSE